MCLLRTCSSGRPGTQGSWSTSCCSAAPGAGFWDSCLCVELSEFLQQKRELVLKQKGPCLRAAVQGKSPFSFSKALYTLCSEKRYTSVGRTQEAGWQDAGYRNGLTLSLHLAATLISSQAALTTYECLFGVFKVILNYLQGMSLPLFQNPLQTERRDGLTGACCSREGWLRAPHQQWGLLWVKTSGKDFVQENNENTDRVRPYAERENLFP